MIDQNDVKELARENWTDALSREFFRIYNWPAVDSNSVIVTRDDSGRVYLGFQFWTERLLEPAPTPIQNVEPISLVYSCIDAVGMDAPAVWSAREDFPRDIGHINPTPSDHPVSLCLARAGLQGIYDRFGIDGVIDRLTHWFHDAKTGQLMQDGWEPVPLGEGQDASGGYFNIGFFQDLAFNEGDEPGWHCGIAQFRPHELGNSVIFQTPALDLTNDAQVQEARKLITETPVERGSAAYIPWVFVWSDRANSSDHQLFGVWNSYGELEEGLRAAGIADRIPTAIMQSLLALTDTENQNGRPVALLVGVWRPVPISNSVFGMASDPEARRLEIRGYLLRCEKHQTNPIAPQVEVQQLMGLQVPTREMFSFTSGIEISTPIAVLGNGALGSCITDFLLRSGIPKIAALDKDDIEPHNLARHTATVDDLFAPKTAQFNSLKSKLTFSGQDIQSVAIQRDISTLSGEEFMKLATAYPIIIDTTADERVRRCLARPAFSSEARVIRIEIFDKGRLGTAFVTGLENRPNLVDLYYALCAHAVEDKSIAQWLRREQAAGTSSEELILGMGCASATTQMPKHWVAQHAAACMPTILKLDENSINPGIGINPLAEDGTPRGWNWFDYGGTVSVLKPPEAPEWEIRLSPFAASRLKELRVAHDDIETGGYLYGGYDFVLKQVYVVAVSDVPPGTEQSDSMIILGPARKTRFERQLERRAAGKLGLVGTWHSHPQSGTEMSAKDRETIEKFRSEDREKGIPTLLVISSPEGDGAHLWV